MSEFNDNLPWGGLKRCIVNSDGTVAYYLDANDSNKKEDGTDVNWTDVENNGQNCMVEIPKFYFCKKKIGDDWIFGVADNPSETDKISINDWKIHPAFFRCRDKLCDDQEGVAIEVDYRYAPAFLGWKDSNNKLRSLPNKLPTTNITIGIARNYAKANGNGWSQMDYYLYYAIQILFITEYRHGDSQTVLGRGFVDGNSSKTNTGATLQYGNNSFGETTGKQQMSYRGIEDFWGNCYYWIDGFYCDNNYNILIGNKGFNDTGSGYVNKGKGATANINGYIGDIQQHEDCGFVIAKSGGSETTKLFDYGALYSARLPSAGSIWSSGSSAGFAQFSCNQVASNAYSYLTASLAF